MGIGITTTYGIVESGVKDHNPNPVFFKVLNDIFHEKYKLDVDLLVA